MFILVGGGGGWSYILVRPLCELSSDAASSHVYSAEMGLKMTGSSWEHKPQESNVLSRVIMPGVDPQPSLMCQCLECRPRAEIEIGIGKKSEQRVGAS